MTQPMRTCPRCNRHVRTDAQRCPFCDETLPWTHALPMMPVLSEPRGAPKYGGPPLRRPSTWIGCLLALGLIAAAIAIWRALAS